VIVVQVTLNTSGIESPLQHRMDHLMATFWYKHEAWLEYNRNCNEHAVHLSVSSDPERKKYETT